jgi:hypothetical protein
MKVGESGETSWPAIKDGKLENPRTKGRFIAGKFIEVYFYGDFQSLDWFAWENLTQKPWFYGLANIEVSGLDAPLSQSNDMWNKYVFANQKYKIDQNRLYVG